MMLNLLTSAYKYEYLNALYESIPKHSDIRWIVNKASHRESLILPDDPRITLLEIDSPDDRFDKRNSLFREVKEGYFMILDEDTLFHPNAYDKYKWFKDEKIIIVGAQDYYNNTRRMSPNIPGCALVDSGNVLCHSSILDKVKWKEDKNNPCPDATFWEECYKEFPIMHRLLLDIPISYYNAQKKQIDS